MLLGAFLRSTAIEEEDVLALRRKVAWQDWPQCATLLAHRMLALSGADQTCPTVYGSVANTERRLVGG